MAENGFHKADNCCCSPTGITGMRGGIHPDHIQAIHRDCVAGANSTTGTAGKWAARSTFITRQPIHLLGGSLSYYAKLNTSGDILPGAFASTTEISHYQATPLNVSLFVVPTGYTHDSEDSGGFYSREQAINSDNEGREDGRVHIFTTALNAANPHVVLPDYLWGYFADGGIHIELQGAGLTTAGVRIALTYVDRVNFSPAYPDPLETLKHAWHCGSNQDFLDDFYGGTQSAPGFSSGDTDSQEESIDPGNTAQGTPPTRGTGSDRSIVVGPTYNPPDTL